MKRVTVSLIVSAAMLIAGERNDEGKSEIERLKEQIEILKEKTDLLIDETSDLKTGFNYTVVDESKSFSGLGAAASKVYYSKSPLSIGGYGEMYYQNSSVGEDYVDVYRFVPYIGYKFSDNLILNTEIEFEHGGAGSGKVIMEFMYLDYLHDETFNLRLGNFLVPMGLINERHEPTLFFTTLRPITAKYLLPSTWSENGAMVYGSYLDGTLNYKIAAVTALDTQANGKSWIRDGRGGTAKNSSPQMALIARVDYTGFSGLTVGVSNYYGSASKTADSNMNIFDFHFNYEKGAFRTYGVYSFIKRDSAETISPTAVKEAEGGYLAVGYDLLSGINTEYKLPLFLQYERIDPQKSRVDGSSGAKIDDRIVGLNFFPHDQVVLKLDYTSRKSDGEPDEDIVNFGFGFIF